MKNRHQTKGEDHDKRVASYRSMKSSFRFFFEGFEAMQPRVDIPISRFGVTDLKFVETNDHTEMTVTLERPGILIGKAGRVINELTEYLSEHHTRPVKVLIIESKLWN